MLRVPLFSAHERRSGSRDLIVDPDLQESPPCRILAVDNDHDFVETLAALLRMFHHDVRIAYDGPTALEIALDFRPDVVLLDLGLPEMDGYKVAASLFELLGAGKVMIVAMTGYGQETDRQRTKAAGFSDHLVKPVKASVLSSLLAQRCPTPPDSEA